MDILKTIATPQSLEHFHLLVFITALSSVVFVPYLAFALGSSALSVWLDHSGRKTKHPALVKAAKTLANTAFATKSVVTFLGLLPGAVLVFAYAQMMQATSALSVGLAGFGFLFLLAALVLLYAYKYTFRVECVLESFETALKKQRTTPAEEMQEYSRSNEQAHRVSGRWGLITLLISSYLYTSAVAVTVSPENWDSVGSLFDVLLSADAWVRFLLLLAFSAGMTGTGTLFFAYAWKLRPHAMDETVLPLLRRLGMRLSIISLLALPLLMILILTALPGVALSGTIYSLAAVAIALFFLAAHFIYAFHTEASTRALTAAFVLFLGGGAVLTVNDHVALALATRGHAAILASASDKLVEEMKSKLGVVAAAPTGEDIYNARCSACHLFDQKKVGPPYLETIPQYRGKKANLIAFILNPMKKNPAYPPMPNQGLKPVEADSIATYLLHKIEAADLLKK